MSTRNATVRRRLRHRLFAGRKQAPCCFCRRPLTMRTATIEHVVPLSLGGGWQISNLRLSCDACNQRRGTEDFDGFRARVRAAQRSAT